MASSTRASTASTASVALPTLSDRIIAELPPDPMLKLNTLIRAGLADVPQGMITIDQHERACLGQHVEPTDRQKDVVVALYRIYVRDHEPDDLLGGVDGVEADAETRDSLYCAHCGLPAPGRPGTLGHADVDVVAGHW